MVKKFSLNKKEPHVKLEESQEIIEINIAILGKSLVGKSALTYSFVNDKFLKEHDPTIENQYRTTIQIEGVLCRLGK